MSQVKATPLVPLTDRQYPHIDAIKDWQAQATTKLLWDRAHDLEARLQAAESTVLALVAAHNATDSAQTATAKQVATVQASIAAGAAPTSLVPAPPSGGGGGGGGGGAADDGGAGQAGCIACGTDGHVGAGSPLTAYTAGQIVCGVAQEFPALFQVVADQPTRDANTLEIRERIIWHLQLAGFTAGQQKNPSGVISPVRVCVRTDDGVMHLYKYMTDADFTQPLVIRMTPDSPPNFVPDGGTHD